MGYLQIGIVGVVVDAVDDEDDDHHNYYSADAASCCAERRSCLEIETVMV